MDEPEDFAQQGKVAAGQSLQTLADYESDLVRNKKSGQSPRDMASESEDSEEHT